MDSLLASHSSIPIPDESLSKKRPSYEDTKVIEILDARSRSHLEKKIRIQPERIPDGTIVMEISVSLLWLLILVTRDRHLLLKWCPLLLITNHAHFNSFSKRFMWGINQNETQLPKRIWK